jgi:MFS family permease
MGNLMEGVAYLRGDRLVLVLLFFGVIPMFLIMPFQNLLVLFAEDVWHVGATGLGTLGAVAGTGGLVGAVLVAWRSNAARRLRVMLSAVFGFGVFLIGFALSPWYLLALPLLFLGNIFANLYGTLNNTAIQVLIPDHVRGRVSSFLMMSFSLPLLGTLPVSAFAQAVGAPLAISLAAFMAVLIAFAFYLFSRPLRSLDERMENALKG